MSIEKNIKKCNDNIECADEFISFGDLDSAKEYLDKAYDVLISSPPERISMPYIDALMDVYKRQTKYDTLVEQQKHIW